MSGIYEEEVIEINSRFKDNISFHHQQAFQRADFWIKTRLKVLLCMHKDAQIIQALTVK